MSAAVMVQPGINTVMDALNPPASFSARKTAVSNVPVPGRIDLPVNPVTQRFSSLPMHQQQQASIGNLLTPPSNISGTGTTPQSWGSTLSFPPPRTMFSPLGNLVGTSNSPVKSEALPPPPYTMDMNTLPPFSTSNVSMPASMAPQHPPPAAHHGMAYMPTGQTPLTTAAVSSLPSQPGPISPPDGHLRAPPTPATSYYGSQPSNTPLQSTFPFSSTSPPAISPPPRISPMTSHGGSNFPPPPPLAGTPNNAYQQSFAPPRPYQPYGMPSMGMMSAPPPGGMPAYPFNSGAAAAQHMQRYHDQNGYPHPASMLGAPPLAHTDRPFKCDQCPQSFNRNHDLKRHKRIHLAVKPFPCNWCDKSFSRKDALKRHILVKGCGKAAGKDGKSADTDDGASSKSDSEGETMAVQSG